MTQPSFVPIAEVDQVRPTLALEVPGDWRADRVAELAFPVRPGGRGRGAPGPDQGFALRLARRFSQRLHLVEGESVEDVLVGCAVVASRRSALVGRAPSTPDLEAAFSLWGFCDPSPPAALVSARRAAFASASHDYVVQRALADSVPEEILRLAAGDVAAGVAAAVAAGEWPATG
ncbi:MAG: hypothetical protein ACRDY3_08525 [Acidimicrobiales bacterium]